MGRTNVAPCSRQTTNVIGTLHECKKVRPCTKKAYSCQAFAHESSNIGREKNIGRETGKTETRRLIERKAAQQNKNLSEVYQKLPTSYS